MVGRVHITFVNDITINTQKNIDCHLSYFDSSDITLRTYIICTQFTVQTTCLYRNSVNVQIRENIRQVGNILIQTHFIITQLPLTIQFLKKAADGGRNVEVSIALLV